MAASKAAKGLTLDELEGYEARGILCAILTPLFVLAGVSGFLPNGPHRTLFFGCNMLGFLTMFAAGISALEKIQRRVTLQQLQKAVPLWVRVIQRGFGIWAVLGFAGLVLILKGGVPTIRNGAYMMKQLDASYVPLTHEQYVFYSAIVQMLFGAGGGFMCSTVALLFFYGSRYLRAKYGALLKHEGDS